MPAFDDDVWELYGPVTGQPVHDISKEQPEKLHELQRLFLIEAVKYNVLPLDDRRVERFIPDLAGRPSLIKGNSQLLFDGMGRLTENAVIELKNKSHSVSAQIVVPEDGAERRHRRAGRPLRRMGGLPQGGQAHLCYNLFGFQQSMV